MYPSIITSFPYPSPTDRLNSPSHSALHNTESSAIGQIEAFIGKEGDGSTLGTLVYDIRSPASNGGGHVQTAQKGGTGQIIYTKGNLLIASNSSTLTKLAVGLDGQIPVANSSVATGINWANPSTTKVFASASVVTILSSAAETSIISTTIGGSVLGTSGVIRSTVYISDGQGQDTGADTMLIKANYGNNTLTSMLVTLSATPSVIGKIEFNLFANNSATVQRGTLTVNLAHEKENQDANSNTSVVSAIRIGSSSINSNAPQTLGITTKFSSSHAQLYIQIPGRIVEKII